MPKNVKTLLENVMPLDPRIQGMLEAMAGMEIPPMESLDAPSMRAAFNTPMPAAQQEAVGAVENLTIPTADAPLPARLYRPQAGQPRAVLAYFHGGGWVIGTLDTHDQTCRLLCNALQAVVVSVDYRLAPEFPFPIPQDDCFNATQWIAQNRAQLGASGLPLLVGGDSAGGNLAAAVALRARDAGLELAGQLLVYPVTNFDFTTESYRNGDNTPMLTTAAMRHFWKFYLKNEADGANPLASPLRASSLAGVAPAFVITAEFDPLRDEGAAYAQALEKAGVRTLHRDCAGMIHGFMGIPVVEDTVRELNAEAAKFFQV